MKKINSEIKKNIEDFINLKSNELLLQTKQLLVSYPYINGLYTNEIFSLSKEKIKENLNQFFTDLFVNLERQNIVGEVKGISFSDSETHNNNSPLVFIELHNRTITYKNSPNHTNYLFREVESQFVFYGILDRCYTPETMNKENSDFTIKDYVNGGQVSEDFDIKRYYFNSGVYLFISYLMQYDDLHLENIISSNYAPILIDLETPFSLEYTSDNFSVSNTALVGDRIYSGIFGLGSRNKIITGKISNKGVEFHEEIDSIHNYVGSSEWISENNDIIKYSFIDGFIRSYQSFIKNKQEVIGLIKGHLDKNIEFRVVLKPTKLYLFEMIDLYEPATKDAYIDRIHQVRGNLNGPDEVYSSYKDSDILINHEIKTMLYGDVPYYSSRSCSKDLYSNGVLLVENFFENTPRERYLSNLDKYCEEDIKFQTKEIEKFISSLK